MPIYEYICQNCKKEFEFLTHGKEAPICPQCKGNNLSKKFSVFAVSQKSGDVKPCDVGESCHSCNCPGACQHS